MAETFDACADSHFIEGLPGLPHLRTSRSQSRPERKRGKVGGAAEDSDEFFSQAVDLILEKEKASVSMLQRQFRIGYNRAARLMDDLEKQGIVGPEEGSKPRKVLITKSEWEEMTGAVPDEI